MKSLFFSLLAAWFLLLTFQAGYNKRHIRLLEERMVLVENDWEPIKERNQIEDMYEKFMMPVQFAYESDRNQNCLFDPEEYVAISEFIWKTVNDDNFGTDTDCENLEGDVAALIEMAFKNGNTAFNDIFYNNGKLKTLLL